jgi:hypothetical protein
MWQVVAGLAALAASAAVLVEWTMHHRRSRKRKSRPSRPAAFHKVRAVLLLQMHLFGRVQWVELCLWDRMLHGHTPGMMQGMREDEYIQLIPAEELQRVRRLLARVVK